jgi:hypothetical protein
LVPGEGGLRSLCDECHKSRHGKESESRSTLRWGCQLEAGIHGRTIGITREGLVKTETIACHKRVRRQDRPMETSGLGCQD